jgi:hypothetical protein
MLASDRFLAQLAAIESGAAIDNKRISAEFISLVSPAIGRVSAANLASAYLFEKRPSSVPAAKNADGKSGGIHAEDPAACRHILKLGYIAAFFLGQYDDDSMNAASRLEKEDWRNIRSILEEAAGDIDLNTLTLLMGKLLEQGAL